MTSPPQPTTAQRHRSILLFLATLASVYVTYGWAWGGGNPFTEVELAREAAAFSATLMGILLAHEMAHYFTARRHGFRLSLPYFIPFPLGFGTLGAVIRLESLPRSRTALLEMAAAGPLAGALCAFAALALGLPHNGPPPELPPGALVTILNDPLALKLIGLLVTGSVPDRLALIHPVALAGWIGCLLTCLNLLPVGQLDGGHVANALFPRYGRRISQVVLVLLLLSGPLRWAAGAVTADSVGRAWMEQAHHGWKWSWTFWGLLLWLLGIWRGLPVSPWPPPSRRARLLVPALVVVFVLTLIPTPIEIEKIPNEKIPNENSQIETGEASPDLEAGSPPDPGEPPLTENDPRAKGREP